VASDVHHYEDHERHGRAPDEHGVKQVVDHGVSGRGSSPGEAREQG
jgi:hypothetical protein